MLELKRRGFRQKNYPVRIPRNPKSGEMKQNERLAQGILKPYREVYSYRELSGEEKEKLIYTVANQLLEAHPDVRNGILQYLCEISLELGQKTEVELNRIRFGVSR